MNTQVIINKLLAILIDYDPYYPWHQYIHHTCQRDDYTEFDNLEAQLAKGKTHILVNINTDDELLEFSFLENHPDYKPDNQEFFDQFTKEIPEVFQYRSEILRKDYTFYLIFN